MSNIAFQFGEWEVDRATNSVRKGGLRHQMAPRAMDVLVTLCGRPNQVISAEELLLACWGSTLHGDNPVHKTITQLRSLLGDNASQPTYIETIRKRGYRTVAAVSAIQRPQVGSWQDGSPFRGLLAFDAEHAAIFFGRNQAVRALRKALAAQAGAGQALVLVLGPSGSGKTSLIRAGLLPMLAGMTADDPLAATDNAVLDLGDVVDGQLFSALGALLLDWQPNGQPLFAGDSAHTLGLQLESDPDAIVARIVRFCARGGAPAPVRLALVIDRFEALFAQPQFIERQRLALIAALDCLARSGYVLVIIACRNDYYPHLAEYAPLLDGKERGAHFDVRRPTHAEIAQIIRLPAQAAALRFEVDPQTQEGLDELLCRTAGASPDALPMLQYTLGELYRLRSADGELGFAAYQRIGGMEGAVGARAEEVIATLGELERAALPRILGLVVTMSDDNDSVGSRRARWTALRTSAEHDLVQALVEARLFVSELVGGEAGFGVAHEALLRRWSRASTWIATHRESLMVRSRITQLAARWDSDGRPSDLLLPHGRRLDEALSLLALPEFSLTPPERALIDVSARRARRRERLRFGAMGLILVLAMVAAITGMSALAAKKAAQLRSVEADDLMGFMLGDFAEKLRPLGRLDLLDSVSAKALHYLTLPEAEDRGGAAAENRAKALQVIAEVRVARGDPNGAQQALAAARALLLHQLASAPDNLELLKSLGANAFWQGQIGLNQSDWAAAQRWFELYQSYSQRFYTLDPGNVDAWVELSYARTNLGLLALKRNNLAPAVADFEASIELKQRALARKPGDKSLSAELANTLSWLASARELQGELKESMRIYDRELDLVGALQVAAPSESLWASRTASALQRRGKLLAVMGRRAEALRDVDRAMSLLRGIVEREPKHRVWQGNLAVVELDKIHLLIDGGAPGSADAALAELTSLKRTALSLTALDPKKRDWVRLQAMTEQTTGMLLLQLQRKADARPLIEASLHRLESLYAANGTDLLAASDVARSLLLTASLESSSGNPAVASQACSRAGALLAAAAPRSGDYHVLDPWVRSRVCQGEIADARPAMERLARMGYRDASYLEFLSHHHL